MMEGLNGSNLIQARHGCPGKIFALIKTALIQNPRYIHVDWLHQYYLRRSEALTWILFPIFVLQVLLIRYLTRVKLVWTLHNIMPHDRPNHGPHRWARVLFARNTDWIRVFAASTVDKASKEFGVEPSKFVVVPEGDFTSFYPNTISVELAKENLGLDQDDFVLLFFGGIRPYKGIEELIAEFRRLDKDNWRLVIAGLSKNKQYEDLIGSLLNPNIIFKPGLVPVEEVQYYMNSANVVVLPFRKIENSGSAILAMGFEKPIVAPSKGVLPYRLINQKQLLFSDELAEGLNRLPIIGSAGLNDLGKLNLIELKKYKWDDFASCFN